MCADKAKANDQTTTQQTKDNGASDLSNYALDLMRGASLGASCVVSERMARQAASAAMSGAGAAAIIAGVEFADKSSTAAVLTGAAAAGVVAGAEAASKTQTAAAIAGGASGAAIRGGQVEQGAKIVGTILAPGAAAGAIIGEKLYQENKKEINGVIKEIGSTPADLANHEKKYPVTSFMERLVCPPLWIIDAKMRK